MGEATGSLGARSWWGQVWSRPGGHRREWAGVQQPHWAASGCLARPLLSSQCRGALSSRLGALSPTVASLRLRAMQSVLNRISILGPPPGPPRPITSHLSCISIGGSEADMPPGAPSSLPTCCSAVFLSHGGAPSCQPWVGVGSVSSPSHVWTEQTCWAVAPSTVVPPVAAAIVPPGWLDRPPCCSLCHHLGPEVPSNRASGRILANPRLVPSHLRPSPPKLPQIQTE